MTKLGKILEEAGWDWSVSGEKMNNFIAKLKAEFGDSMCKELGIAMDNKTLGSVIEKRLKITLTTDNLHALEERLAIECYVPFKDKLK